MMSPSFLVILSLLLFGSEAALVENNKERTPQLPLMLPQITVIAGGGAIGLSVAYYLALSCKTQDLACRIIVVDAFHDLWNSSSSFNTGAIHKHWFQDAPRKILGTYSFEEFRSLRDDESFQQSTSIKDHASYNVTDDGNGLLQNLPGWVNPEHNWKFNPWPEDGSAMMLKPNGLGNWLVSQIEALGVEIFKPAQVVEAGVDGDGQIYEVTILKEGHTAKIPCNNLVLSAGAWTPALIEKLFPASSIDLQPVTDGGSWMIIKNPDEATAHDQITLMLGYSSIQWTEFASRDDGTIWMCGLRDSSGSVPDLTDTGSFPPTPETIKRFTGYAERFVKPLPSGQTVQILEQGLCYRPTNKLNRPIIASVTSSQLDLAFSDKEAADHKSGVFLCTGHGPFGITLGLGSGKVMSALILGQEPEIDITGLNLP